MVVESDLKAARESLGDDLPDLGLDLVVRGVGVAGAE